MKGRVLVVDDDEAIRTMVARVLRREHFDVECARDGFEAIEKLSHNDYATVLLDLMMPRVDGQGVLRFLRTGRHAMPSVILMSANVQAAAASAEVPVLHVLAKPFDIRQLIDHVRECDDLRPAEGTSARS